MDCDKYMAADTEPFLPCGLLTSNFMVHIIAGYAKPGKNPGTYLQIGTRYTTSTSPQAEDG